MSIEAESVGAGKDKPPQSTEIPIFQADFESGDLSGWTSKGGEIGIISEGGKKVCRIVSQEARTRQKGEESTRWADSTEGAFLFHDLPAEKLSGKRVWIYCRYRLLDVVEGNDWVGATIIGVDAETKRRSWRGGPFLKSKDPNKWTEAKLHADIGERLGKTTLRVGFGRAAGVLLIDEIRLTAGPLALSKRSDEAIVDNRDAAFGKTGEWNVSTKVPGHWGADYLWCAKGAGEAQADWTLIAPDDGRYAVQARWTWGLQGAKDRATNAPFGVKYPGGSQTVRVNMADAALAGRFNSLAVADLKKGQPVNVTLSNDADNSVVADAVRLIRLPDGCAGQKLLFEETFLLLSEAERKASASQWVMEGGGISERTDEGLRLTPKRYTKTRSRIETDHFTYWLNEDFPADFAVEWDFRVPDLGGLAIIFICAKGMEGEDIFDPKLAKREGVFERYFAGDINCYHISYYAGGRGRANVRKNHGFHLVFADDDLVVAGGPDKWHRLRLTRFGQMLELTVNGQRCLTWIDDGQTYGPILGGGKIGLRQQNDMRWGEYRNIRVYELQRK